jgi:hypothetical protein
MLIYIPQEDEDDEEDSINAAIQRVISQSMHDDDDIDLLPKLESKPKVTPKSSGITTPAKSSESPKLVTKISPALDTLKSQTPKPEATPSKPTTSKLVTPEGKGKTATSDTPKILTKSLDETSKITPKSSVADNIIKVTSKPIPSLESITKISPKAPLSSESPVSTNKLVSITESAVKATPKPTLTAELTTKFTTYGKSPQPTLNPISKTSPKVTPSSDTISKTPARSSPSTDKPTLKPVEVAKVTPKPYTPAESLSKSPLPSTSQSDLTVKNVAKLSPSDQFGKTSAKNTPEPYKFGSKLASALDAKSTPKSSVTLDVLSKSTGSTPKSNVVSTKTSASIAKSVTALAAADSPLSKQSNKQSVDATGKPSPKTSLAEVIKTPAPKIVPSTTDILSKTKSPPTADTSKVKSTLEVMPNKSGPSKPSESTSKTPLKPTPQFTPKESLKREAKKEPRKKALKKTVSKEFVEDTSSDSDSDTGMKLVIDKLDEESVQDTTELGSDKKEEFRKENLSKSSSKKPELESKSILEKKLEVSADIDIDQRKRKKEELEVDSSKKSKMESSRCMQEEEEADSSLNSLLCEETIPGSPPPIEAVQSVCPDTPKVREIPFASMPAGGNGASTSTVAQQSRASTSTVSQQPPKSFSVREEVPEASPRVPAVAAVAAAPAQAPAGGKKEDEAAPVMDNTPPTTPDSSISTISGSPRE